MNEQEVGDFFDFFKHKHPTEIRVFDKVKYPLGRSIFVKSKEEFIKEVKKYNEDERVDVFIKGRDGDGKTDDSITSSNFIFFEIDEHDILKPEQAKKVEKFLKDNNMEIGLAGMSGGGYHYYIPHKIKTLNSEIDRESYKELLRRFKEALLSEQIDIDPVVFNLSRVSRVLGTMNWKREVESRIIYDNKNINIEENHLSIKQLVLNVPEDKISSEVNESSIELLEKYGIDKKDKWLYTLVKNKIVIQEDSGGNSIIFKNAAILLARDEIPKEEVKVIGKSISELCKGRTLSAFMGWYKKALNNQISEVNEIEINKCIEEGEYKLPLYTNEYIERKDKERQIGIGNKLKFIDLEELKNYKENNDGEIVEKLIPCESIGAWGGKRASLKSWIALNCAVCVSNGLEFLNFKSNKVPVIYIDRENGYPELKKRISMIEEGLDIKENKGELYFLGDYAKLDTAAHLLQIEDFITSKGIKLIFIDVYRRMVSFDENDANKVSEFFVDRIKPFIERTGASIIFLHHEKKGESPDEMDNLRGSSDFVNYLDFVLLNTRRGNKIIVKQLKSRRSKEIEPFDVQIETDEINFMKFSNKGKSEGHTEPERCSKIILIYIIENSIKEICYSEFIKKCESFDFAINTAKRSLSSLMSRGILEKGYGKRTPYKINLNGVKLEDYINKND